MDKENTTEIWSKLEIDICQWLSSWACDKIYFRNSFQAIIGFPSDGCRSDGMLTDGKTLLAVEVEVGQTHPDTNTGKYWLLHSKFKQYEKIVLFHIYTPAFNSYGWRKSLGEFYIEKMKSDVPIEYIQLDYRKSNEYASVLSEVKEKIRISTEKEFLR